MLQVASNPWVNSRTKPVVPPLENGDHLTREEFERRFDATPGLKKAELIEGIVFVSPPVSHTGHGSPHFHLAGAFANYIVSTPGVAGGQDSSLRLDIRNMPQPDLYLLVDPKMGGQAKVDAEGYIRGAPDLIAEIAGTTAAKDLHEKLDLYQKSGVRQYLVWRTYDAEFDVFIRAGNDFVRCPIPPDGIFRSTVFPGLWIDCNALIAGDLAAALKTVQQGVESPEHAAFTQSLAGRAK